MLLECRRAFEQARDIQGLGTVLSALATVEDQRGRGEAAIGLENDALRYEYLAGDVTAIAVSYHNLGNHLLRHARQPAAALACHLAAALVRTLAGTSRADDSMREAVNDLRAAGTGTDLPGDVADLCGQVAGIPGADLDRLLDALAPEPGTAERAFGELVARVRELAEAPSVTSRRHLASWDPVIAAVLAADGDDAQAAAALDAELDKYQDSADWAGLAVALRRLRGGEGGPDLLAGLDDVDTAIMTRALDAREGKITIPVALWEAMAIGPLLGDLVAAAGGDADAAGRADQVLRAVADDLDLSPLADVLRRILGGDRDPGLAGRVDDPVQRAVVVSVLGHVGAG